jgi:two-component system capsular synthesis sensor histidine kinase RcsC
MPNMDGPTATKAIRELGFLGPIFGVTGNALPSDIEHFTSHGADVVLIKPTSLKDLKATIQAHEHKLI